MLSVFDQGALPPCPQDFNLAQYVLGKADEIPDKVAFAVLRLSGSERWSYAMLKTAVLGTGTGLLSLGMRPGQRVMLRLGNTVDFPIAYLGAISVGLIPIPTSSQLTETEVAQLAKITSPDLVIAEQDVPCPTLPGCKRLDVSELKEFRSLPPAEYDVGDPERIAYILFTSGTSGKPRAVAHAHRAIWARQMMWKDWYGISESDRLLHAGAFNWSFTLGTGLLDPWSVGATALIPDQGIQSSSLPLLLKRHDATLFAAAPGVFRQILKQHNKIDLPKLRHGLCAGEKLTPNLHDAWKAETGLELHEAFGMTECSTFISASPNFPTKKNLGRPQTGRRVAIVGDDGPVKLNEVGQIAVSRKDPGLMLEYVNAPDETEAKFQGEWFLTGDFGSMDEDLSISYQGRSDDLMNAGGYRVSPIEVENALSLHPDIDEIAVTAVEIKKDVKVIGAFYVSQIDLEEESLKDFANQALARYKQPRLYKRVESLPRGAINKLLRKKLKLDQDTA